MRGGMQTGKVESLFCKCGKETSKIIDYPDKQISIHFTRKSTYWHIFDKKTGQIKRTFSNPTNDKD